MKSTAPHYLLITEAKTIISPRDHETDSASHFVTRRGQWRFVLEQMGTDARIEVADEEPHVIGERLELLAVVRGLEALEQPSRVTLLTASRFVGRGLRQGIHQWREDNWRWERFGNMTLIKNHDLWKRVDQALKYHKLECRVWDFNQSSVRETNQLDSSTNRTRRNNVIRPHGDSRPTARKSVQPTVFHQPVNKVRTRLSGELDVSRRQTCEGVDHPDRQRTASVKPLRAGRAYGYAVN